MKNTVDVYIKVGEKGMIPKYQSLNAAGCDVYASQDMVLKPGETKIMPLDIVIAMPEDIEAQIRPRSGLSLKTDIRLANCVGTVDSDFRDEVGVIIQNTYTSDSLISKIINNPEILKILEKEYKEISIKEYLKEFNKIESLKDINLEILEQMIYIDVNGNPYGTIYIKKGERIAQMIFNQVRRANFIVHSSPEEIGHNRGGGFGHTGKE